MLAISRGCGPQGWRASPQPPPHGPLPGPSTGRLGVLTSEQASASLGASTPGGENLRERQPQEQGAATDAALLSEVTQPLPLPCGLPQQPQDRWVTAQGGELQEAGAG